MEVANHQVIENILLLFLSPFLSHAPFLQDEHKKTHKMGREQHKKLHESSLYRI